MTATGFLLFLEPLLDGFGSLGDLTEDLWSITIIWLLLTMLSGGRLTSRVDKTLVGLFVLEFAIEAVRLATGGDEDGALAGVEGLVVSIGCLGTAVVIGLRYARASAPRRRALLPSVAGIGALLLFAFAQGGEPPIWFRWVAVLSLLAVPAGFLVGLLRSRLARGGLADLFRRLPTMRGEDLQPALAQVLGDPTVEIVRGHPTPDDGRGAGGHQRRGHAGLRRLARRRPRADRGGRLGGGDRARVARAAGAASSRPATTSGGGWSATCTTARSSGSSRSPCSCG